MESLNFAKNLPQVRHQDILRLIQHARQTYLAGTNLISIPIIWKYLNIVKIWNLFGRNSYKRFKS